MQWTDFSSTFATLYFLSPPHFHYHLSPNSHQHGNSFLPILSFSPFHSSSSSLLPKSVLSIPFQINGFQHASQQSTPSFIIFHFRQTFQRCAHLPLTSSFAFSFFHQSQHFKFSSIFYFFRFRSIDQNMRTLQFQGTETYDRRCSAFSHSTGSYYHFLSISIIINIFCFSIFNFDIKQVSQWNLVNEGGSLKLTRSWKVKSFNKGLEFFRIIADLADAQGIFLFSSFFLYFLVDYWFVITVWNVVMQVIILIFTLLAGIMLLYRFGLILLVCIVYSFFAFKLFYLMFLFDNKIYEDWLLFI